MDGISGTSRELSHNLGTSLDTIRVFAYAQYLEERDTITKVMALDHFKELEFEDKEIFDSYLRKDPPLISELTFTNLFIWRHKHRPAWRVAEECLLILFQPEGQSPFGIFPVGEGDKKKALDLLSEELGKVTPDVRICRVDEERVRSQVDSERFTIVSDRDNSDYVYAAEDLIRLSGNKYHRKKNHLNQFVKKNTYEYKPLNGELVDACLEMQEAWCRLRECVEDPGLSSEDLTIREALTRFGKLDYCGAAILMDGQVEAFSLAEPLNQDTVVVHFEKANPEVPGLYAAINQFFCSNAWSHMKYVNREQDLGIEGLRKAKESYYPHHMINKYTLIPK